MKEEVLKEGRGPRVQRSRGPKVPGTKISQSLNMSLTLKKVHFVMLFIALIPSIPTNFSCFVLPKP